MGLILTFLCLASTQQVAAEQFAYRIAFATKAGTPFSFTDPSDYLSFRAQARRSLQGIAIDSTDLPINPALIDSVLRLTGGKLHGKSKWYNLCVILVSDSADMHALDGKPFVVHTQLVGYYPDKLHRTANPLPPSKKTTAADATHYGNTWIQTLMLNGQYLHGKGHTGAGKLIAVLDEGFIGVDSHPAFAYMLSQGRLKDAYNTVLDTTTIYNYSTHGTKVFSTIAGYVPGTYVGSAPDADFALYVTEDGNSEQPIELLNMLFAIERADSVGADIVSVSLGYNTFDNPADNFNFATDLDGKSTVAARAANMATRKGILVVATAGNEGSGGWGRILTPGDADSALTIGSVDNTGLAYVTSGLGPNALGRVKPDVCALGHYASIASSAGYNAEDGTSYATPQIAGWAACLWQEAPYATPFQLRQAIIKCASSYATPGTRLGYGIPNFQCTAESLDVMAPPPPFAAHNWVIPMPNPFHNELKLSVHPDTDEEIGFELIDVTGRSLLRFTKFQYKGYNLPFTVPMPQLPAGIYLLRVTSSTQQQLLRLQKD